MNLHHIPTRVAGIPCLVHITDYSFQAPHRGSAWSCESDQDFYGWEEIHYEILDRRGRPAPWLARKATDVDDTDIKALISHSLGAA